MVVFYLYSAHPHSIPPALSCSPDLAILFLKVNKGHWRSLKGILQDALFKECYFNISDNRYGIRYNPGKRCDEHKYSCRVSEDPRQILYIVLTSN